VKLLYILMVLMLAGCVLMVFSAFKVLDEMNAAKAMKPYKARYHKTQPTVADPKMQSYVIAGYLGFTFFVVGTVGSVVLLAQAFNRGF
jgi:hypothetical protein